jgi:hypothetical protein
VRTAAATDMRSAAAATTDVATATSMRTATSAAALLWGLGIGRGRQRGRKNNGGNPEFNYRHIFLESVELLPTGVGVDYA